MVFPKPVPKLEGSKRIKAGVPLVSVYLFLQDCNVSSVQFVLLRVIQNDSNQMFFVLKTGIGNKSTKSLEYQT